MDRVAGRGVAGTVPRPQDGESAAPKRGGFCGFASNLRGFQGGTPPWSQGDSPRKGGRERSDRWKGETRSGFPLQATRCGKIRVFRRDVPES